MSEQRPLQQAVKAGLAGAAGFTAVFGTILLLRNYGESAPELGYLPELLLFQLLVFAIGFGGAFPALLLGAEWQRALLAVLGSHLLWLMAIYAAAIYVDVPQPNAMVLAVAGGFGVVLLLSEQSTVETWWLGVLALGVAGAVAVIWLAPLPGYLVAGLVWALFPALGSLILHASEPADPNLQRT